MGDSVRIKRFEYVPKGKDYTYRQRKYSDVTEEFFKKEKEKLEKERLELDEILKNPPPATAKE